MKLKRNRYSLRNCNPPEKKKRREINELDFKNKFPFYSFDSDKVDLSLLRRFLYQNKIPVYYLYSEEMIKDQMERRSRLSEKQRRFLPEEDMIEERFEILDL